MPVDADEMAATVPLEDEPLYRAPAVGASTDGLSSADHDMILYFTKR